MFLRLKTYLSRRASHEWTIPLALFALCLFAFGIVINRLGYTWDDWPPHLVSEVYGNGAFWRYYAFDRPYSAWTYTFLMPVLGHKPLYWHMLTLVLRWLASVGFWWTLRLTFPGNKKLALFASFLFAVYPAFSQQSIAVTYHQAWLEYCLFFLSLGFMLLAARQPKRVVIFSFLSVLALILNFSISEYFIGVEIVRPLLLFIVLGAHGKTFWNRVWETLKHWSPYILVSAGYVIWRLFFIQLTSGNETPKLITDFLSNPSAGFSILQKLILQDGVFILFSNWYRILEPGIFAELTGFEKLSFAIGFLVMILAAAYFTWLSRKGNWPEKQPAGETRALGWSLLVAGIILFSGPLPAWLIERQASEGFNADRYALVAMSGASLFWATLIDWASQISLRKALLVGSLVGLAVVGQLQMSNEYHWLWLRQQRFYWQMYWRAPSIQPGTAFFSELDAFPEQSLFSTSSAVNLLYPQPGEGNLDENDQLAYWVYAISPRYNENNMTHLVNGKDFRTQFRIFNFNGMIPNTILFAYDTEISPCLWILNPLDVDDPDIPPLSRMAISISNLDLINQEPFSDNYRDPGIFGPAPTQPQCHLYQKADLARQFQQWETVVQLGEELWDHEAPPKSVYSVPHEWLPFIEGYARTGEWDKARTITEAYLQSDHDVERYGKMMCSLWKRLPAGDNLSTQQIIDEINLLADCGSRH